MTRTGGRARGRVHPAHLALGILAALMAVVFAAHHELLLPQHAVHAAPAAPSAAAAPHGADTGPHPHTTASAVPASHGAGHGTGTTSSGTCDSSDNGGCLTAPTALPLPAPAPAPDILLPPPAPPATGLPPAHTIGPSPPPDLAELSILRI
ncbi:hypothetical protein HNR23_001573 [Nocardiopsis mwathae]|uniref:Uncharacterized protein n=1 Tax=Nocardiopsis mwathae TaxID=1472723 RepID=A0A7X0D4T0_9ACTN|nr:DUF6153 family protein [Nocardiopsis mwathae]MBB6171513.1 hypothetical protein [Nocardiopsis mwathae]